MPMLCRRVRPVLVPVVLFTFIFLATASDLSAQTATALLREGDVLGSAGTINSINGPGVNHIGGFSVQVNTSSGGTTLSHIWGNAVAGPGSIIISEGTIGPWVISAYETFHGFNDRGEPCYGTTSTNTDTGLTGLDGVFLAQTPILNERDAVASMPGFFSTFNSRPGCTSSEPYWVGGITNVPGSSTTQNRVLFYGTSATPKFKGGDLVGGVGLPQSMTVTLDFSARFSRLGTHHTFEAQVTGATTATDQMMTVDGNVLFAGGGMVREGSPVPASVGGLPGELWAAASFEEKGIHEDGRVLFTGDTTAATTVDDIVFFGGQIVLREGTVFAGPGGDYTISGAIESGSLNRQGDWAVTWDVNPPVGANREALFVNGVMVLQENDLVDLTGDGVPDANGILRDFGGATSMVIGPRDNHGVVSVYFTADIDVNNTPTSSTDDVEGLFRLDVLSGVANQLPVAGCQDVTVKSGEDCTAEADVNDGSSDPDDDPFTLSQSPAGPYGEGQTEVTLTIRDIQNATDTCQATVTVTSGCDDGNACTADSCVAGVGCVNEPISCDDGNGCTDDSCDPGSGCVYTDNTAPCSDGDACTENDTCGGGSCQPGGPLNCDDGNACTDDSCDPASGCAYTDNSAPCEDGSACTAGDTCGGGSCQPGAPVTCDDGTQCTADSCDPATGCVFTPVDGIEANPHARGYWKRLCIGPHSGNELTAADAACVAGQGSHFAGVASVDDICAVLNSSGSQCVQGEIELMVTALNLCHVLICEATPIDSDYSDNGTVGDSYTDAEANLGSGGDCGLAHHLGSEINTGRAINVDGVAFAKLSGGGARLNWTAMGGGTTPVTKYNVWRRQAGSMAAFSKIGETTTLSFDDTTPGRFEYEVTPVR